MIGNKDQRVRKRNKPARPPLGNAEKVILPVDHQVVPQHRLALFLGLFVALSGFILYFNTIFNDYALDDQAVIQENRFTKQGVAGIPILLRTFYWEGYWDNNAGLYRPLSMITFALEWQFFPGNPHAGHVTNVLLYALTGFLLFRMLRRMMPKAGLLFPFLISLLFMSHPVHTEVVANIKSRDEILCLLLFILAIDHLLRYFDMKKGLNLALAVVSYFLCLFAKESAVAFILIFPLVLWFFRDLDVKKLFVTTLPLAITVVVYFTIRMIILGDHVTGKTYTYLDNSLVAAPDLMSRLATAFFMLGKYLKILIFPHPLSYDYSFLEIPFCQWTSYQAFLPLLVYGSGFIYAVRSLFRQKKEVFAFSIFFYLLSIAVVANVFILIGATMADRFLYIPSLGFCIALVYALFRIFPATGQEPTAGIKLLFSRHQWVAVISLIIFSLYSVKTFSRNFDWKDNKTLFSADAGSAPGSSRIRTNNGTVFLQKFDKNDPDRAKHMAYLDIAISEFEAAIKIDPNHPMAYLDLGAALYQKNDYAGAITNLKTAIRLDPGDPKPYSTLGNAYYRIQDFPNAIINLKKCIELKVTSAETYNFLGGSYFGTGDFPNAVVAYLEAIKLEPKNVELHTNLGSVYGSMGDYRAAVQCFLKAEELKPGNPQILLLIGMTYQNMGIRDSALLYNEKAAKLQQQ
jgi:Flp pilus assembly protein TadD